CDAVSGHPLPGPVGADGPVAYSRDGRWLASGCKEGIRVWDADTCREARTIRTTQNCDRVAFTTDGRLVALTRGREPRFSVDAVKVQVWDPAEGRELNAFTVQARFTVGVAISPDGRRLVTVNWDRNQIAQPNGKLESPKLNVWDLDRGRMGEVGDPLLTLVPHLLTVKGQACSPDGKWLATAGLDPAWTTALACGPLVMNLPQGLSSVVKLWD